MFAPTTKILVVDDMMTMRKLVSKSLKELGFTDITEANDGIQAWEKLSKSQPPFGMIVSDWNMPNCTGLDLLKRCRGDSVYKNVPFLLVTAEAEASQIIDAKQAGVSSYIIKPFMSQAIGEKIKLVYESLMKKAA